MTAGLASGSSPPTRQKVTEQGISRSTPLSSRHEREAVITTIPDTPDSVDLAKYEINLLSTYGEAASPKPTQENLIENLLSLEAEAEKNSSASTATDSVDEANIKCPATCPILTQQKESESTNIRKEGKPQSSVNNLRHQSAKVLDSIPEGANLMENTRDIATQTFTDDPIQSSSYETAKSSSQKASKHSKSSHLPKKSYKSVREKQEGNSEPQANEKWDKVDEGNTKDNDDGKKSHTLDDGRHRRCGFISKYKNSDKSNNSVCEFLKRTARADNTNVGPQGPIEPKASHSLSPSVVRDESLGHRSPSAKGYDTDKSCEDFHLLSPNKTKVPSISNNEAFSSQPQTNSRYNEPKQSRSCGYLHQKCKMDKLSTVQSDPCSPSPTEDRSPTCNFLHRKKITHGQAYSDTYPTYNSPRPNQTSISNNIDYFPHEHIQQLRRNNSPNILQVLASHPKSQCQYLKNYQKYLLKQAASKAIERSKELEQRLHYDQNPFRMTEYNQSFPFHHPDRCFIPSQMPYSNSGMFSGVMHQSTNNETHFGTLNDMTTMGNLSWPGTGDFRQPHRMPVESHPNMFSGDSNPGYLLRNGVSGRPALQNHDFPLQSTGVWQNPKHVGIQTNNSHLNPPSTPSSTTSRQSCEYLRRKPPPGGPREELYPNHDRSATSPVQRHVCNSDQGSSFHGSMSNIDVLAGSRTITSPDLGFDAMTMVSRRPVCEFILKNQGCIEKINKTLREERKESASSKQKHPSNARPNSTPPLCPIARPPSCPFVRPPSCPSVDPPSSMKSDEGTFLPRHLFQMLMAVIVSYFLIEKESTKVS